MAEKVEYVISLRDLFSGNIKNCITQVKSLESGISGVKSSLGGIKSALAGAFALAGGSALGIEIIQTTAKMEGLTNAITFASGSAQEGSKNMGFLNDTAKEMALPLESAISGFKTLSASMMGTKLQGQGVRDVFKGVSTGVAVMNLTSEQAEGAYLALGQMMSKGKVQAEELRGQLGERIPGAFQIAARAMHMTTAQLDKFMSDGKLVATDFLPKFAKEMQKTFGPGLAKSTKSLQSNLTLMNNEFLKLKTEIGQELYPVIIRLIGGLRSLMPMVRDGIKFVKEHAGAFEFWGKVLAAIVIGNYVGKFAQSLSALSLTMATNPFVLMAIAVAGLIIGLKKLIDMNDELEGQRVKSNRDKAFNSEITFVNILTKDYMRLHKVKEDVARAEVIMSEKVMIGKQMKELQSIQNKPRMFTNARKDEIESLKNSMLMLDALGNKQLQKNKPSYGKGAEDNTPVTPTAIDKVHGGGIQNLTINIDKLVDGLNINTTNITESKQKLRDIILETLTTAVRDGGIMARN